MGHTMTGHDICTATNGTYGCQRYRHDDGEHAARFTSANVPYVLRWGTGAARTYIDRPA